MRKKQLATPGAPTPHYSISYTNWSFFLTGAADGVVAVMGADATYAPLLRKGPGGISESRNVNLVGVL